MTRIISILLALALAVPAVAQDTSATATEDQASETGSDTTDTETPAETPAPTPSTDSGLDMGATPSEPGEPQVGQPYVREEFGDWQLQCVKTETGEDPCQLYQLLMDEENNPVAEFSLFRLPEGGQAVAGATVVVPLETALTEDLLLGVDGAKGKRYRFSFCSTVGCFARIGLTQADIDSMKRGAEANLTITPWAAPDAQVRLNMSLIGFTAGYEEVTEASAQQR
ncbi:invasion associated locus B family protein [Pseudooceanicola sp.]|jgi:invasion protein IalB|uniref:invasion associated locus B family protein n=1 Tax=Pseudooceanicola sp. TaxID=1914328 RepID=UPI00405A3615